jgi:hypothetical protein
MKISNKLFLIVTVVFLALWAVMEWSVARDRAQTTWTCVDGFGDRPYTWVGSEPPHMDCRRNQ